MQIKLFQSKKAGKIAIVTMDNGQFYNIPNTWGEEAFLNRSTRSSILWKKTRM